jgi:ubiquinone/menaquinone biosynthesis C-methylase UbiE
MLPRKLPRSHRVTCPTILWRTYAANSRNLGELVRNHDVLDFGCGFGDQAAALAREFAALVTGLDTYT